MLDEYRRISLKIVPQAQRECQLRRGFPLVLAEEPIQIMVHAGSGEGRQFGRNVSREGNWKRWTRCRAVQQSPPKDNWLRRWRQKHGQAGKYHPRGEEEIQLACVAYVVEVCSELQCMSRRNDAEVVGQLQARFAIEVHVGGALA